MITVLAISSMLQTGHYRAGGESPRHHTGSSSRRLTVPAKTGVQPPALAGAAGGVDPAVCACADRYDDDGALDATFGVNGKLRTDFSAEWDGATGVAIQADGRIVVVGAAGQRNSDPTLRNDPKFALARYNGDGTLDATFGVNGKVETIFTTWGGEASAVAIQADGKIVAAGWGANSGGSRMVALARYLAQ